MNEIRFKSVSEAEAGKLWRKEGKGGRSGAYRYRNLVIQGEVQDGEESSN